MFVCYYCIIFTLYFSNSCDVALLSPVSTASTCSSSIEGNSPLLSPVIDEWLNTFSLWSSDYKTQALNRLIKMYYIKRSDYYVTTIIIDVIVLNLKN